MQHIKIGVIGGGAAGMTAAITAAWQGAEVTLLEGGERVGRKILSTGNGKCNLGNLDLRAEEYCGGSAEWIKTALSQFGSMDTVDFFRSLGLMVKEKNGYLYPVSEQASTVLDVLRTELKVSGVQVVTECKADSVQKDRDGLFVVTAGTRRFVFERLILACGGKAAPKTGSDGSGYKLAKSLGHTLVPVVPALVQLRCGESYMKEVAGVRAEACITVLDKSAPEGKKAAAQDKTAAGDGSAMAAGGGNTDRICEWGELQLTDYGISGIPVFQLSRKVNYLLREKGKGAEVTVSVDLLPDYDRDSFQAFCIGRKLLHSDRTVEEFFTGILNKKLMRLFIKLAGLKEGQPVEEADPERLDAVFALCKDWRLHITGSNSFDNAQVCAGGVSTKEVGPNLESLLVPGLYFAGEVLDVDGRCGGYNLHWAWCSGSIAGRSAARS